MVKKNGHDFCSQSCPCPLTASRFDLYYYPLQEKFDLDLAMTVLDPQEHERYQRFGAERAAQCFLLARWMLKTELARRLDTSAEAVELTFNQNGKPRLAGKFGQQNIHFSLSHSRDSVVVLISDAVCGVDVEEMSRLAELKISTSKTRLARFIGPKAAQNIIQQAKNRSEIEFYFAMYWTAMESVVKLHGSTLLSEKANFDLKLQGENYTFGGAEHFIVSYLIGDSVTSIALKNPPVNPYFWQWDESANHQPIVFKRLAETV